MADWQTIVNSLVSTAVGGLIVLIASLIVQQRWFKWERGTRRTENITERVRERIRPIFNLLEDLESTLGLEGDRRMAGDAEEVDRVAEIESQLQNAPTAFVLSRRLIALAHRVRDEELRKQIDELARASLVANVEEYTDPRGYSWEQTLGDFHDKLSAYVIREGDELAKKQP